MWQAPECEGRAAVGGIADGGSGLQALHDDVQRHMGHEPVPACFGGPHWGVGHLPPWPLPATPPRHHHYPVRVSCLPEMSFPSAASLISLGLLRYWDAPYADPYLLVAGLLRALPRCDMGRHGTHVFDRTLQLQ